MIQGYVIQRNSDGAFVAPSGQEHSYVKALQLARIFSSREEAERNKCENETIVSLEAVLLFQGFRA